MRIGDVARAAGVSARALRYYEEQGLLTSERTPSGQRSYPESAVERVRLIQQFFTAGLPSRTIQQLLPCVDAGTGSPETFALLQEERDRISTAMADLAAARDALDRLIHIAHHPTPEHCPALREPAWAPYAGKAEREGEGVGAGEREPESDREPELVAAGSSDAERDTRIFFRDVKPYDAPAALDELAGPTGGTIELPHSVYWGPKNSVDLETEGGAVKAYQAIIREGTVDDQRRLLNPDRLRDLWPTLTLPERVRNLWEDRFPELRALVGA